MQNKICPLCNLEYKHILSHIRNMSGYDMKHSELLREQYKVAKQLFYDDNFYKDSCIADQYLLNYEEYKQLWNTMFSKDTVKNRKVNKDKQHYICPVCNQFSTYNNGQLVKHIRQVHVKAYEEQEKLINELFHDENFTIQTASTYTELILPYNTCLNIWKQNFSMKEFKDRELRVRKNSISRSLTGKNFNNIKKEILSKAHANSIVEQNKVVPNATAVNGYRPDIGHNARSTYEANIYRIFQYEGKKYLREYDNRFKIIIDGIEKFYIVDILDIDGLFGEPGTYIEVKGYMDEKSLAKINAFRKQYTNKKLITIGKNDGYTDFVYDIDYCELEEKYKDKILWETKKDNIRTNPERFGIK